MIRVISLILLALLWATPGWASVYYLFPTDCANLDEKSVDDGDTTSVDLTTTPTECALEDLTGTGYEIGRVTVHGVAKATANAPDVHLGVKIGTSFYDCARLVGYTGADPYSIYACDWESSPDTSADWTISEINNMKVTAKESGADIRITQLYVAVETDEETDDHTGVLLPGAFIRYGLENTGYGHGWYSANDRDGMSPAGTGGETFLWESEGRAQNEGYYLAHFSPGGGTCTTANADLWATVLRYQPGGDRYEVRAECNTVADQIAISLVRYNDGTATTLVSATQATGSDVSKGFVVLAKVNGVADPVFTVDVASDANDGKYTSVITYTDNSASAIETSGLWGFRISEVSLASMKGMVWYYPLFASSFSIKVTGLPTGYSARVIDKWGQVAASASESSGTALIPWDGYNDLRFYSLSPTTSDKARGSIASIHGNLEVLNGSSVVVADTGLIHAIQYGQTWNYNASKKLFDYRIGAVEDSSTYSNKRRAQIWYQLDRPGTVTITCNPSCSNNSARYTYVDNLEFKQNEYINVIYLDNLDPSTTYQYSVKVDAVEEGTGRLNTGPLSTSDVVGKACYSSCVATFGTPFGIANTIANADECDFFVLQGDTPYLDVTTELKVEGYSFDHPVGFREITAIYKAWRADPYWRDLFHNIPVLFILNDHEMCNDYFQGAETSTEIESTPGRNAGCLGMSVTNSKKAYKLYSHYSNPASPTADKFWYKFNWGKSAHYFADQIYEKEKSDRLNDFGAF